MPRPLQIGDLHLESDKPAVYAWLRSYLRWHLHTWSRAAGLSWSETDIDDHIQVRGLVDREWSQLVQAAADSNQLVAVARDGARPVGILHAEVREDRYLQINMGVVSWLFVEPLARGSGASDLLLGASNDWMKARGLRVTEVFVTANNAAAAKVYRRNGYSVVDHRLFAQVGDVSDLP